MSRRGIVERLSSRYVITPHLYRPLTSAISLYNGLRDHVYFVPILNIFSNQERLKCSVLLFPLTHRQRFENYFSETPARQVELLSEQVGLR